MSNKRKSFIPGRIFIYILLILLVLFLYKSYTFKPESLPANVAFTIPTFAPSGTPLPNAIPYAGPNRKPSKEVYQSQEKEIVAQLADDKLSVGVVNQIDNYAYEYEHVIPVGGGGWCVLKKESGSWKRVFCSSSTVWCSLNKDYGLPPALLSDCVSTTPSSTQ